MKILFICSSNVCRSPYCEYVFKKMVKDSSVLLSKVEDIKSSAVLNLSFTIHPKTKNALVDLGFDEREVSSHRPTYFLTHPKRFENADIIIGMSKTNKLFLPRKYHSKFITLSEVATGSYTRIPDPFLVFNETKYNKIMFQIKSYLELYAKKLQEQT